MFTDAFAGLCEVDGFWYALGGFIPGSDYHTRIFNNVERYQPSSNSWVPVASMPEGVMSPAVVSLHGVIYVLGEVLFQRSYEVRV